jgi:hypothetical protein
MIDREQDRIDAARTDWPQARHMDDGEPLRDTLPPDLQARVEQYRGGG